MNDRRFESIKQITYEGFGIDSVTLETSGTFQWEKPDGTQAEVSELPAFVRVRATALPETKSFIRIEIWLPAENWNKKFCGTGNGGLGGELHYSILADPLREGYAVAHTDLGTTKHLTHPEVEQRDFGYKATFDMTRLGQIVTEAFYGVAPSRSYYQGGSTGGQMGLKMAQCYPELYDGIYVTCPVTTRTHLHIGFLWTALAMRAAQFTDEQLTKIARAAIAQNVGKDGGAPDDTFLTDPRLAAFDYEALRDDFTPEQIALVRHIHSSVRNPRTGENVTVPPPLGSEATDNFILRLYFEWPLDFLKGMDYDITRFDFDRDVDEMNTAQAADLNAVNTDLSAFHARGGKLIASAGTSDAIVPFTYLTHYYEEVIERFGGLEAVQEFFRMYIVPGQGHGSTHLADKTSFDALVRWVEQGEQPAALPCAWEGADGKKYTRPAFPYPAFPHYTGGDPADAANFKPVVHPLGYKYI